jgi:hypothetical protein
VGGLLGGMKGGIPRASGKIFLPLPPPRPLQYSMPLGNENHGAALQHILGNADHILYSKLEQSSESFINAADPDIFGYIGFVYSDPITKKFDTFT